MLFVEFSVEISKMIQYNSITSEKLKIDIDEFGYVDIQLMGLRTTACKKMFDVFRAFDEYEKKGKPLFRKLWDVLVGLVVLIYIFIFHGKLLSLMSFYYISDDISYKGRNLPDGSFNFRLEKIKESKG